MTADLVVREWGWSVGGVSDALAEEHNAVARTYAEQAAVLRGYVLMIEDYEARSNATAVQLAARTAEREHWFERSQALVAQLEASEAARGRLREALISAKAAIKGREHTGFIDDALAEPD